MDRGIALEYTGGLPRIIAVAQGRLLKKLLEIAEKNRIPIYKDEDLAGILSHLPVGSEIPEDLFRAVAEVLAYCYRVNKRFKDKMDTGLLE